MSCKEIDELLGFSLTPISNDGLVAWLSTPYNMPNKTKAPFYIERLGSHIRFFDDGCLYMYFCNLGLESESTKNFKFLRDVAKERGGRFTDDGTVEVIAKVAEAPQAFLAYSSIIQALITWEEQHRNINHEAELFVEEVALHLRAWKGVQAVAQDVTVKGVTGTEYRFPLAIDGKPVLAILPTKQQSSSALHRLVDITTDPDNANLRPMVVIDDRRNAKKAQAETKILSAVSTVLPMSRLISNASSVALH